MYGVCNFFVGFQSQIPLGELLTKNTYVGRTFIQPSNRLRQLNVALKFSEYLKS